MQYGSHQRLSWTLGIRLLLGLSGQICGEASYFSFLENDEVFAVFKMTLPSKSGIHVVDISTSPFPPVFYCFVFCTLLASIYQRALSPEFPWSESPHPFAVSGGELTLPASCPLPSP